jgi:hypothetical protein
MYIKATLYATLRALETVASYCVVALPCAVRAALLPSLRCRAAAACCCARLSVSRTLCELARIAACVQEIHGTGSGHTVIIALL